MTFRSTVGRLALGMYLFLMSGMAHGDDAYTNSQTTVPVVVLDVRLVSSNTVSIGTDVMSLAEVSNYLTNVTTSPDLIAVHGVADLDSKMGEKSSIMTDLATAGLPLMIVEEGGEYQWKKSNAQQGVHKLTLDSAQWLAIKDFWHKGEGGTASPLTPRVKTSVEWNAEDGSHEFKSAEIGLFGNQLWLTRELVEDDDDESPKTGIQLKKDW